MTKKHNISLYEEETRTEAITVEDQDGNVVDLTGGSARYLVVDDEDTTVFEKTQSNGGITFTAPASGELTVDIASADTGGNAGNHSYYLKVTDSDGNTNIVLVGQFLIRETPF